MKKATIIIFGIITILLVVIFLYMFYYGRTPTYDEDNTNDDTPGTANIKLAMLDYNHTSDGIERGCDKVVLVDEEISTTTAPLTAALKRLFEIETTDYKGWYNFIPKTKSTLNFDRATVSNGVAKIYLSGNLSGLAGICDDPRAEIQIEETALQFATVSSVQLYLNNNLVEHLYKGEAGL